MQSKQLVLVSEDLPEIILDYFQNCGYGCVRLPKHSALDTPVASHPDMLFSVLSDGTVLADKAYLDVNPDLLLLPISFKPSSAELGGKYPYDIAFDVLVFADTVYGKLDFIAPEIRQSAKKEVNVAQGYTLCSTLITDKCAATADSGIYRALTKNGVPTLKIAADGVGLDGYSCGFIGGASAFDKLSNTVIFFGDLRQHPDCKRINDFLREHGHSVHFFENLPLKDCGGVKFTIKKRS